MLLDSVTKVIPFFHMAVVSAMVFVGVPRIMSYTAFVWGVCAIMSIPLTEGVQFELKLPSVWKYSHLACLGVIYTLLAYI